MSIITPFAQTFFVDPTSSPDGIFAASIDVVFSSRDDALPISLQLRPTINGFPDVSNIYIGSEITLSPAGVSICTGSGSDLPSFNNGANFTRFTFASLVYLAPGEHAIVFATPSTKYQLYVSDLSQTIIGNGRKPSAAAWTGSAFRAQNSGVWSPYVNQSLMFRVNRATFDIQTPSFVKFKNQKTVSANVNVDVFVVNSNDIDFGKTATSYSYQSTDLSGSLMAVPQPFLTQRNYAANARFGVSNTTNGSFIVTTTLKSTTDYISPVLDPSRFSLTTVRNVINNGNLTNNSIAVTIPGSGYNIANAPVVTINAVSTNIFSNAQLNQVVSGSGATLIANVTALGTIDKVYVSGNGGSLFTETARITIAPPTVVSGNTNAAAIMIGETSQTGGNMLARYITRKVVLADGFDATDIQVYLSANIQPGANVAVYYKVLSDLDPDQNMDNKYWNLMFQGNNPGVATDSQTFLDYQFVSGQSLLIPQQNITYVSGGATYTNFKTFAIKLVLYASSPSLAPTVANFRAIALA